MPPSSRPLTFLACLLLLAALLAGGSTHSGYLSDVVLELLACPILMLLAWHHLSVPALTPSPPRRLALIFTLALLAVPLLQVIPLSPSLGIWPRGSLKLADGLDLIGMTNIWRPLSAAPEATWLAWLSLLPPVALFWAVADLGRGSRRLLCSLIVLIGAASVVLAFLQLAGGPNSELRFYEFTNRDEAVGFFANRNHLAAFLYCASLFTGVGAFALLSEVGTPTRKNNQSASIFVIALAFCLLAAMTAVQAMARSRAGVLLQGVALISLIALAPPAFAVAQGRSHIRKILVLVAILSAAVIGQLLLYRFVDRFAYESIQADARVTFLRNTIEAARAYMPFGSGLGSFVRVYGTFEKPADTIADRFANHAHDDWAELWLETGVAGLVLAALFVAWVVATAFTLWKAPEDGEPLIDRLLQRAGLVAIALLLAHSFVDYPIRTEAIMAVFALAAGLQMAPPPDPFHSMAQGSLSSLFKRRRRHRLNESEPTYSRADIASAQTHPAASAEAARSVQAIGSQRWQTAAPWPEEWRGTQSAPGTPAKAAPREAGPPAQGWGPGASKPPPHDEPETK